MNDFNDACQLGEGSYRLDPQASVDTLLDDAGEWLEYAVGINEVLAEGLAELGTQNHRHMVRLLGAALLLTDMGTQCLRQAKVRRGWDGLASLGGG